MPVKWRVVLLFFQVAVLIVVTKFVTGHFLINEVWFISGLVLAFLITACLSDETWKKNERKQISDFLKTVPDSVISLKPSGLYYIELKAGVGRSPVVSDIAYFKYIGRFLNGIAFDSVSTVSAPYAYLMGSFTIVAGVDEGLRYMKAGGKALLLTPSDIAYGSQGIFNVIPGYTPLLWEIELDSVKAGNGR